MFMSSIRYSVVTKKKKISIRIKETRNGYAPYVKNCYPLEWV